MLMAIDKACDQVEYVQLYLGDGTAAPSTVRMTINLRDRTVQDRIKGKPSMDTDLTFDWCEPNKTCIKIAYGTSFDHYFLAPNPTGTRKTLDGDEFVVQDLGPSGDGEVYSVMDLRQNHAEQRIVYDPGKGIVQWEGFAHGQTEWRSPNKLVSKYGLFATACRTSP
jgi:hypothetical protein